MSRTLDPETLARLHYVRAPRAGLSLDRFPDFLIIGPQRTGTTWLHAQLRFHPEIFLSEPKEIFFFSRIKTPESPKFQSDDLGWYLRFFRDPPWRWAAKNAITLARYGELYRPRVRGEATATYAALDPDVIAEIAALNPQLKAILMIRDPVERAWSHAKKDLVRKRKLSVADVPDAEFQAFFRDDYQRRCARYGETYDNWAAHLGAEDVLVRAFDEIGSDPERMLLDVMRFLGVRSDRRYIPADAGESVNPTAPSAIPAVHRRFLEDLLCEEIAELKTRFGFSWAGGPKSGAAAVRDRREAQS
jgi:sulfotransferase family protein